MGKYVTPQMNFKVLNVVRRTLPMDTGNLRYNATKSSYYGDSIYLTIGGMEADYFEYLEEGTSTHGKHKGIMKKSVFPNAIKTVRGELKPRSRTQQGYHRAMYDNYARANENLARREARFERSASHWIQGS